MKQIIIIKTMILFTLFVQVKIYGQTLYNGVGHIPAAYQETWNKAGLIYEMSSGAPTMVKVINPGDASSQIGAALSLARNYVNYTGGIAIIYFGEGTFDFTSSITLAPNDSNIVF